MLSIGLMSGTSMDGIDAALIKTDGNTAITALAHETLVYDVEFKTLLKAAELAVRQHHGDLKAAKNHYLIALSHYLKHEFNLSDTVVQEQLKALLAYFQKTNGIALSFDTVIHRSTELHGILVKQLLKKAGLSADKIDVIGYHGQTLFHQPSAKITIQVGNGQQLATTSGITVVNDFRTRDIEAGGQGAPFAPLYHQALAVRDRVTPVAIVNCGGIANVTLISGVTHDDVIGFDTGPGNGLIDRYVKRRTQGKEQMDTDGHYGSQGTVNQALLTLLYEKSITNHAENFFLLAPPKSLDIGDLNLIPELDLLSLEDACATLEAFTAETIVNSTQFLSDQLPKRWILAGGGWHNPVIRRELETRLKKKSGEEIIIQTADEAGWNSSALEAQIFAYLAVRSLQNLPISLPNITGVPMPLSGGNIHLSPNGPTDTVAKLLSTPTMQHSQ